MATIFCGTLTQNIADYPGSGTVNGWCVPVDCAILTPTNGVFWSNVDRVGAYIQIWDDGHTTRYPVHVVVFDKVAKTGWLRVWVPQFTTSGAVVLEVWLDTEQEAFNPTITDLSASLTNNATTNSVANWVNDTGTLTARTSSPAPFSGTGYFASTGAETRAHFSGDIDVTAYATEIDDGRCWFRQITRQAGFGSSDLDRGEMEVQFLDSGGATVMARLGAGDVNMTDQTWRWRQQQRYMPPTTRKVRIFYHGIRNSGVACDAYLNLWQPALVTCPDAYAPWKVYQDVDGDVNLEHVGLQGYQADLDSTGNQAGWLNDNPKTWDKLGTTTDTNCGRGVVYDLWGSSSQWYGTDNPSAGTFTLLKGGTIQTMSTLSSTCLADSGVTGANNGGCPAFYSNHVYFSITSPTQSFFCKWDSSGNFVSKFETTAQMGTNSVACEIIPPNQPGWTGADPRVFTSGTGNSTTIWEWDLAGNFIQAHTLTYAVGTIRGLRYWDGWLYICGAARGEVGRLNPEFHITSGVATNATPNDLQWEGFLGPPAAGTYTGIAFGEAVHGDGISLFVMVDNGTSETAEEYIPFQMERTGGGGHDGVDGEGVKYVGVRSLTTFALFVSADRDDTSTIDRFVLSYWQLRSGTANTARVSIGYHDATDKIGVWDNSNGWLDSGTAGTTMRRYCAVYVSTTERRLYYDGGNKVTDATITQAPSGLNVIYGGGDDDSESNCWERRFGYTILYPGDPSDHLVLLDSDSLNSDFWAYEETGLEIESGPTTIVPTGSVEFDLIETLTTTATIVPTGSVQLGVLAGLSSTATVGPTGSVEFDLIESLTTTATIGPTGSIVFGVLGDLTLTSEATITAESAYTFFGVGSNPGPLPYTVYFHEIRHSTSVEEPALEVAVGPIEHTVERLVRNPYRNG